MANRSSASTAKASSESEPASEFTGSVQELLAGYARILAELRRRRVLRSNNAPAGDYAEWLVARALGGVLDPNSTKSTDVKLPSGERVQVKARVVSRPPEPSQLQTSAFRSWDVEWVALVQFGESDYRVERAVLLPAPVAKMNATFSRHVNGDILHMRPAVFGHAQAEDITEKLRIAARDT